MSLVHATSPMPAALSVITNLAHIDQDQARLQLRNALTAYFHAQAPPAPTGYPRWDAPATHVAQSPRLLVGDPVTLMVSPRPPTRPYRLPNPPK